MRCYRALILTVLFLPGCTLIFDLVDGRDGGDTGGTGPNPTTLKTFESEQALTDYFVGQITQQNARGAGFGAFDDAVDLEGADADGGEPATDTTGGAESPPQAAPGEGGGDTGANDEDFSQTTIQEEGVDEADVVKTDGTYLYLISNNKLRIVRASPPAELAAMGEVPLEGYGRELYLHDNRVVALTQIYGGYVSVLEPAPVDDIVDAEAGGTGDGTDPDGAVSSDESTASEGGTTSEVDESPPGDAVVEEPDIDPELVAPDIVGPGLPVLFERPKTIVTVIDTTDPLAPTVVSTTRIDGAQTSSRMINGRLHLGVSNYQNYYFDVLPRLGQAELDLTGVEAETLLPTYEQVGRDGQTESGPLLTWQDVYRPDEPDGFGVVAIVSMDVDAPESFQAVGIIAEPGLVYSSLQAMYLTDANYGIFGQQRQQTEIYKLAYAESGAIPSAAGIVPGRVLNQYSMSEHNGYLRVATTVDATFFRDGNRTEPYNNVYVLDEVEGSLETVGSIEDIASGETIQSARFIGDRGFLVTFEQIDPLFTLDLADPLNPRQVGELKVPGFSTFIVPMDENHLLTVGRYIPQEGFFGNWGVQLSIFDISTFSDPVLQHVAVLGDQTGAYSEALDNPKAFTYFADAGMVALPLSIYYFDVFIDDFGDVEGDVVPPPEPAPAPAEGETADEPPPPDDGQGAAGVTEPNMSDNFDGIVVYRVSTETGFESVGSISTQFEEAGFYGGSYTRGVFIGDDIFAVSDVGIRAAPVTDMESAPYELILAQPPAFDDTDVDTVGGSGSSSGTDGGEIDTVVPAQR